MFPSSKHALPSLGVDKSKKQETKKAFISSSKRTMVASSLLTGSGPRTSVLATEVVVLVVAMRVMPASLNLDEEHAATLTKHKGNGVARSEPVRARTSSHVSPLLSLPKN